MEGSQQAAPPAGCCAQNGWISIFTRQQPCGRLHQRQRRLQHHRQLQQRLLLTRASAPQAAGACACLKGPRPRLQLHRLLRRCHQRLPRPLQRQKLRGALRHQPLHQRKTTMRRQHRTRGGGRRPRRPRGRTARPCARAPARLQREGRRQRESQGGQRVSRQRERQGK